MKSLLLIIFTIILIIFIAMIVVYLYYLDINHFKVNRIKNPKITKIISKEINNE